MSNKIPSINIKKKYIWSIELFIFIFNIKYNKIWLKINKKLIIIPKKFFSNKIFLFKKNENEKNIP